MKVTSVTIKSLTLIIVMLFVMSSSLFSQKVEEQAEKQTSGYRTIFGNNNSHGGYGALTIGYTTISDESTMVTGVQGAWLIGHSLGLGVAGKGFFAQPKTTINPTHEWSAIFGGYGGLFIEPVLFWNQPIHVSLPIVIGGGLVGYESGMYKYNYYPGNADSYDTYFIFEPGIELEINVTHYFRLALGTTYRLTSDIDVKTQYIGEQVQVLKNNDLQNFSGFITFKFGKF